MLYHFKNGHLWKFDSTYWIKLEISNQNEIEQLDTLQDANGYTQSMLIDAKRLLVMNKHDDTFWAHLPSSSKQASIELLGCKTGLTRWGYGIQYTSGNAYMYTLGGRNLNTEHKECFIFDIMN